MRYILALFLLTIFISACTSTYNSRGNGVIISLVPGSPPSKLFYSSVHKSMNNFDIELDLKNKGQSDAYGAVYIVGYDPNILYINNSIPPQTISFCDIHSFGDLLEHIGASVNKGKRINIGLRCREESTTISIGNGEYEVSNLPKTIADALKGYMNKHKNLKNWTELLGSINLDIKVNKGKWSVYVGFDIYNKSDTYLYGRDLMLALQLQNLTEGNFGKSFYLKGDNRVSPGGDETVIDFPARIKSFPPQSRSVHTSILIDVVYGYTTFASTDVCIDPNPYRVERDVCKMSHEKTFPRQRAPIQVVKVLQEYAKTNMIYTIVVRHVGSGRVIDIDALKKSPYKQLLQEYQLNKVKLAKMWIGNTPINPEKDCDNAGKITLVNGEGTIVCRYDITNLSETPAFVTPISIELWYGYEQAFKKDITIKKIE